MAGNCFPLYLQIAAKIKLLIETENYSVGDKLPFENWFIDRYDVSRVTVRKAIDSLIGEGVIERRPHHGLYVSQKKFSVIQANSPIYSFESTENNHSITDTILSFNTVPANDTLMHLFHCGENEMFYYLQILRYNNETPFVLQYVYLAQSLLPNLDILLLRDHTLHEIIESNYNMKIGHVDVSVSISTPSMEQSKLLNANASDNLLKVADTLFLADNRVIRYSTSLYAKSVGYKYTIYT